MKQFLLATALAAASLNAPSSASAQAAPAAAALPDADPALWLIKDEDTTIYLFGTFHALDGKTDWFNDEVRAAFDKSEELVVEAITPDDPSAMAPIVMKYAVDASGKPLSAKLSPEGRAKLAAALATMGAPPSAFDTFKPFFVTMTLAVTEMQKMGMSADAGTEAVLRKAAKAANKPVSQLESVEFQIGLFDRISEPVQLKMLEDLLGSLDEIPALTTRMLAAWNKGDADGFKAIMDESDAQGPEAYKIIFSERNAKWAEWIDQRLDKPGTIFLAVGTGHLAGKDAVPQLLKARGIETNRAN